MLKTYTGKTNPGFSGSGEFLTDQFREFLTLLFHPRKEIESPMLTEKKKEMFRKLLNDWLDELLDEANKTVSGMSNLKDNLPDPADRATLESDRNFTLRIRDRERKLIGKIKEALERIEGDTYGICEGCGEEIGEARLKARPVTTLCIDCKKRQENEEKVRGI